MLGYWYGVRVEHDAEADPLMTEPIPRLDREQGPRPITSDRYRVLADERRRTVVRVLADRTDPIGTPELATQVVARETLTDCIEVEIREDVLIELHHKHLPALADAGFLEYDPETKQVDPRDLEPDPLDIVGGADLDPV